VRGINCLRGARPGVFLPSSPDNPISRTREYSLHVFFPLFFIRNRYIPEGIVPEIEKCPVCCIEGSGPAGYPPGPVPFAVKEENTGTQVAAAEFWPAGMHRADTFTGCPFPEKGAGNGFYVLLLLIITENVSFIRVHGNDTLLTIGVPNTEFVRTDLLAYADDLPHSAATVTAALAYKCHITASLFCRLATVKG
jgi:hypothetical protein